LTNREAAFWLFLFVIGVLGWSGWAVLFAINRY
jgi:hypothetical protein